MSVKARSLLQIGKVIYCLYGKPVPKLALNAYISLANSKNLKAEEYAFHCAYTFPAVLYTLGAKGWSQLFEVYKKLLKSSSRRVVNSMVTSVHEIAKILSPNEIKKDLDHIAQDYLRNVNTVKLAMPNIHEFIRYLESKHRLVYLDILKKIIKNSGSNWYLRESIAIYIGKYISLYDIDIIYKVLMPIIGTLMNDFVMEVRTRVSKHIYKVFVVFKSNPKYFAELVKFLKKFYISKNYKYRQLFIEACELLMDDEKLFVDNFIEELISLQEDKILNVRVTLAKVLYRYLKRTSAPNRLIQETIERLKNDSSKEVREFVSDDSEDVKKVFISPQELNKIQDLAAKTVNSVALVDEEMESERKRRQSANIVMKLKIDEVDI